MSAKSRAATARSNEHDPGEKANGGASKPSRVGRPPFDLEDVQARRRWLWKLAYRSFEARAQGDDKLDTRFVLHLSDLLGLAEDRPKASSSARRDELGDMLHNMSVEEFIQYKNTCIPL